jgi:high-affinity iron transporter
VGAIIAYLQKSAGDDKKKKQRAAVPVYVGSVVGIIASFLLAWLLNAIKLANSASQEVIEGVTALTAVLVLYYVSNWMLSKSETDAWTAYIKSKAQKSSEKGSIFALAFTAFLAVFREGAEVVLFFQPMLSEDNISSVWMGFAIGCICLVFVYLAIHLLSVRIPIKPFFTATSVLMFIMSISFLGAGIKELIEGNVLTPTYPDWLSWIPTNDFLDVLGIYGCLETLIPQLILLVITVVIFVVQTKKNRAIHEKAEAERAAAEKIRIEREKKAEDISFKKRVAGIYKELSDKGADEFLKALAEEENALNAEISSAE